jgi:hypothetical protein
MNVSGAINAMIQSKPPSVSHPNAWQYFLSLKKIRLGGGGGIFNWGKQTSNSKYFDPGISFTHTWGKFWISVRDVLSWPVFSKCVSVPEDKCRIMPWYGRVRHLTHHSSWYSRLIQFCVLSRRMLDNALKLSCPLHSNPCYHSWPYSRLLHFPVISRPVFGYYPEIGLTGFLQILLFSLS